MGKRLHHVGQRAARTGPADRSALPLPAWALAGIEWLRTSFWLLPAAMCVLAAGASGALPWLDRQQDWLDWLGGTPFWWLIYNGNPDGARTMLGAIAASAIGLAGTVFSITIAALSLASSQLGPRLLRNFIGDRGNQFTLGTFVGTHLFSLLALRQVHGTGADGEGGFVPQLTITFAIGLAILSIGTLVWFIHHLSQTIQAPNVLADVGRQLVRMIEQQHAEADAYRDARPPAAAEAAAAAFADSTTNDIREVEAGASGYVEAIDYRKLVRLGTRFDLQAKMLCRPGAWVFEGRPLMLVRSASRLPDGERDRDDLLDALARCVYVDETRTLTQDVEFARDQVVEVGVRALSPGVNDPFTAMTCVDRLAAAVLRFARIDMPPIHRYDTGGHLRLILQPVTFAAFLSGAFDPIRQNAESTPQVQLRMLEVLAKLAQAIDDPVRREALRQQAERVLAAAAQDAPGGRDLDALRERERDLAALLERRPEGHDTAALDYHRE